MEIKQRAVKVQGLEFEIDGNEVIFYVPVQDYTEPQVSTLRELQHEHKLNEWQQNALWEAVDRLHVQRTLLEHLKS